MQRIKVWVYVRDFTGSGEKWSMFPQELEAFNFSDACEWIIGNGIKVSNSDGSLIDYYTPFSIFKITYNGLENLEDENNPNQ